MGQGNLDRGRRVIAESVTPATAGCAAMCSDVHERAAQTHNGRMKPPPDATTAATGEHAGMCNDVRQRAAPPSDGRSNPPPSALTHRQIAAARLLALGRSGRDAAREIGINEHTMMRWRRVAAFADEVRRQHGLVLAEQVRLGRSESVDAYATVAEKIARKYGLAR